MKVRRKTPPALAPRAGPVTITRADGTQASQRSLGTKQRTALVKSSERRAARQAAKQADEMWGKPSGR